MLLGNFLGRFVSQNFQILADNFPRHRGVNDVIDEATPRCHLKHKRNFSDKSQHGKTDAADQTREIKSDIEGETGTREKMRSDPR